MLSLKFTLALLFAVNFGVFAQQLTSDEKIVFDEIVFKRRQVGEYAVISKWVIPIRYKIAGETEPWLIKDIDSTFSLLKTLTGLDIKKTEDDTEANVLFGIGEKGTAFLSPNMAKYFTAYGGTSYKTNRNFEIYRVENFVNADRYKSKADLRAVIKKHIVKSLGFFQSTDQVPNSIFYSRNNNKQKLDSFDSHIIKTLYLPSIKPGMTKDDVDKILQP